MAWVYLTVAGLLEIVWASAMKHSEGFTKLWPTVISLVGMVASMVLLVDLHEDAAARYRLLGVDRHRRSRRLHLRHRHPG